jgi:hypothetical protein
MVENRPLSGYFVGALRFYRTTKGDECFHRFVTAFVTSTVTFDGLIRKKSEDGTISTFRSAHLDIRTKGQVTFQDFIVVAHYGLL